MSINKILTELKADLIQNTDSKTKSGYTRFFKEKVVYYGVAQKNLNQLSKKYWTTIKDLNKEDQYKLFEQMLRSDYCEEAFLVGAWMPKLKDRFEKSDLAIFRHWIDGYLNNWAKIDTFCDHTISDFLYMYPELIHEVISWARSPNRWLRRASAVSLIIQAKNGEYLNEAFKIANTLLEDKDEMVQKGYGSLLKEESRKHQKEVFNFVLKNKSIMPRTALRYAIELMPQELRQEAMKKN